MKERPIIFNGDMVRAILSGRKTQTRRPIPDWQLPKHYPDNEHSNKWMAIAQRHPRYGFAVFGETEELCAKELEEAISCPCGNKLEHLWVRETFQFGLCTKSTLAYRATHKSEDLEDGWREPVKWRPSIHMPRWASRITLEITNVRVERLKDISEQDAISEGMQFTDYGKNHFNQQRNGWSWQETTHHDECLSTARFAFGNLWESNYGEYSWDANPWVWVIDFRRIDNGN
ncbi:hypothetical protein FE392_18045 [Xenorhabdus sp. 12]|uniref:Phage protein n=1 Tax=Xenorhabdus santafensis TaxID=2582833 RepID=A0ABU4SEH0_9GAMM|nr:hypothetical protein [Xenorhabdus sp. 12]MDX7989188.1 hypothetical protein [Xenorhabdus sp. 12]